MSRRAPPNSQTRPVMSSHNAQCSDASTTGGDEPRSFQHRDGYAVLEPNISKREKIQKVAQAETRSYEAYRQSKKKVQYTTSAGTVGGEETSNRLIDRPARSTRAAQVSLRPSLRSQSLRAGESGVEAHKTAQRRKAESNEQTARSRQQRLDDDRKQKNEQFFQRLEAKNQ